ncbi:LCP family protein [Brevibacillus marinus]|uniref:LCP family protein n=1 Tax=Brevibacillus marinus TaxID=2496837 RepID=UPI001F49426C|nr:LCP family protein [Brevibacillus marinus]
MNRWQHRRMAKRMIGLLLLALIGSVAGYTFWTAYQFKKMTREWYQTLPGDAPTRTVGESSGPSPLTARDGALPQQPREPAIPLVPPVRQLKPFTLLLIGVDSREGERARSDTLMLAAVHPGRQRVYLLSIPRDSYMELPGRGFDKVNHAMAYGGPALLKGALERYFAIPIDRYITIDFQGFRRVVDELGGIQLYVKKRMKYTDPTDGTQIDLQPGLHLLNGKQALDYARYRKSDIGREDTDDERIVRQQEILRALARKGASWQGWWKASRLLDILGDHIRTNLSEEEIASLWLSFADAPQDLLVTDTLNGRDQRIWHNGLRVWYFFADQGEARRIRQRFAEELQDLPTS